MIAPVAGEERPGVRFEFTGGCRIGMAMVLATDQNGAPIIISAPLRSRSEVLFERTKARLASAARDRG